MKAAIQPGLAAVLALSMTAPAALAQYQPTAEYQRDMNRYENDRAAYDVRRGDYEAARRDYERRVSDYQAARAAYDNRYGYGSYTRRYGAAPVWDNARWAGYEAPAVDRYGRNVAYTSPSCVSNNNSATRSPRI